MYRTAEASTGISGAVKIRPDSAWSHGNLAVVRLQRRKLDAAIESAERALAIAGVFYWNVARSGSPEMYARSSASIQRAIDLDPDLARATEVLERIETERRVRARR